MLPIRRDIRFALPAERIKNWHEQGPFITHFFNALSLLFPQGELFFHGQRAPLPHAHP